MKIERPLLLMVLGMFLFYATYAVLDHYTFQTEAWDFGIYDQAVWKISQLRAQNNTINGVANIWGDHFEVPLIILAFFYRIWSSPYVLLIVQAAAIAIGLIPVYWLAQERVRTPLAVYAISFGYIFFFGFQSAIAFDFHLIVCSVPVFAFALYFLIKQEYPKLMVLLLLALLIKENVAIYVAFFGVFMLIFTRARRVGLILTLIAAIYFMIITQYLMPYLLGSEYFHFKFEQLGDTPIAVAGYMLTHPKETMWLFILPIEKLHTQLLTLRAVGYLPFFSPTTLFLMIPMFFERFLSTKVTTWTPFYHYSAVLAPFLFIGVVLGIENIREGLARLLQKNADIMNTILGLLVVVTTIFTMFWATDQPFSLWNFFNGRLIPNAERRVEIKNNQVVLDMIPVEASVIAQYGLVPHLSQRDQIYFPFDEEVGDAEYVILSPQEDSWPLEPKELAQLIHNYLASDEYGIKHVQGMVILFEQGIADQSELSDELQEYLTDSVPGEGGKIGL